MNTRQRLALDMLHDLSAWFVDADACYCRLFREAANNLCGEFRR